MYLKVIHSRREACFRNVVIILNFKLVVVCGPGSSVIIATGYGLDGSGIESRWGKIFRTGPDRHWGPPSLLSNGSRGFRGGGGGSKAAGT
jgi:hypothetical protein